MLCLVLPPRRNVQKLDFQSEFCTSKIILIFFLLKNKGLGANFLLKLFFDNFNLKITFLMKSGSIFEEVAKLGKASCDAYNWGRWLIS